MNYKLKSKKAICKRILKKTTFFYHKLSGYQHLRRKKSICTLNLYRKVSNIYKSAIINLIY